MRWVQRKMALLPSTHASATRVKPREHRARHPGCKAVSLRATRRYKGRHQNSVLSKNKLKANTPRNGPKNSANIGDGP